MRQFHCQCNEVVFYDNTQCVSCSRELGYCPTCRNVVSLIGDDESGLRCGNPSCGIGLRKCYNYRVEGVCNCCIPAESNEKFCECCRFNSVIPDLTKGDNRIKWLRLEKAKRRAFYDLDVLGLPRGTAEEGFDPPLSFEFKEPTTVQALEPGSVTTSALLDGEDVVMTGHLNGVITINIHEADPVERERLRVHFGERNRSLVGHFRHELAHYYWDLLVRAKDEDNFAAVFGSHLDPVYHASIERYYREGPPPDWRQRYTSAYASMHPWEDFAETFMTYLEVVSVLDTAYHMRLGDEQAFSPEMDLDKMIGRFIRLGTVLNEINRGMGLKDLLVRSFEGPVFDKLRYIQQLINASRVRRETVGLFEDLA
ncbi:MAG: putative zinc-binding metallopeptidase [Planctomycetota bacterium]